MNVEGPQRPPTLSGRATKEPGVAPLKSIRPNREGPESLTQSAERFGAHSRPKRLLDDVPTNISGVPGPAGPTTTERRKPSSGGLTLSAENANRVPSWLQPMNGLVLVQLNNPLKTRGAEALSTSALSCVSAMNSSLELEMMANWFESGAQKKRSGSIPKRSTKTRVAVGNPSTMQATLTPLTVEYASRFRAGDQETEETKESIG